MTIYHVSSLVDIPHIAAIGHKFITNFPDLNKDLIKCNKR